MEKELQRLHPHAPLSVSALTDAIKKNLEDSFPSIYVQGEVSNLRVQSSGHIYFSLKDSGAQVSCVMFRGNTLSLKSRLKVGDQVLLVGEINVYPPRGNYQLIARRIEHTGLGQLLLELERLKKKLEALGWFQKEHKKPLPPFPKKIGIVSSPTGAALQDMINILKRRASGFHVILNPVKVQGEGAAKEIARAIEEFNTYQLVDVIIVGRGGGSVEDLWAFNEEIVAQAIYQSKIPIISAVGHETDTCLSDYVADLRAPTPSAAAELVLEESLHRIKILAEWQKRLDINISNLLSNLRKQLTHLKQGTSLCSPVKKLELFWQKLDDLGSSIEQSISFKLKIASHQLNSTQLKLSNLNPKQKILRLQENLQKIQSEMDLSVKRTIQLSKVKFNHLNEHLKSLDPKNLLKKGYSILFSEKDHSVILSAQDLSPGEQVEIHLGHGKAKATINQAYDT